jgi:hypothetical protein
VIGMERRQLSWQRGPGERSDRDGEASTFLAEGVPSTLPRKPTGDVPGCQCDDSPIRRLGIQNDNNPLILLTA